MKNLLVLSIIILLTGCASYNSNIIGEPYDTQKVNQDKNGQQIVSNKKNTVSVRPLFKNTHGFELVQFDISIENRTKKVLDFRLEDIVVELEDFNNSGYLKKYTHDDVASLYKQRKGLTTVGKVMYGVMLPIAIISGHYAGGFSDEWKKQDESIELLRQRINSVLKDTKILPGKKYEGILFVSLPLIDTKEKYQDYIYITVHLFDDTHKFRFQLDHIDGK